jgi:hypothetical protein
MDYSILLGIHYPQKEAASNKSRRSHPAVHSNIGEGSVRNFSEVDGDVRFKAAFSPLADKISKMKTLDNRAK